MRTLLPRSFFFAVMISFLFILMAVLPASAAPADPRVIPLTQPDGSTFSARQWGDEWNNGYETVGGFTIVKDSASGFWVYASRSTDGNLAPAMTFNRTLVVGKDQPAGLTPGVRSEPRINPDLATGGMLSPQNQNFGSQKLLVLLVDFPNKAGVTPVTDIAARFFGATSSVNSFYKEVSRNQFSLAPATESNGTANDGVVGWLHMTYNHINTGSSINTSNQQLVKDALIQANSSINFASFDTNNDGFISSTELHIIVIVAGYEASYDPSATPNVWGHRWALNDVAPPVLDGKIIGDANHGGGYAQFGEIHRNSYNTSLDHLATIGIMVHELGHDISWPDLYDTSYYTEGVGSWSIMGAGSWNTAPGGYDGSSPAHPDAFLKYYQGWIKPISMSGQLIGATLASVESTGDIYLLGFNPAGVDWNFTTKAGHGEYFLVENRQKEGYDAGLPGCGLLIWHIDETKTPKNNTNNGVHPLVYLEQADGQDDLMNYNNRGDAGDPYPGTSNNTSFTKLSTPNSSLYSGQVSSVQVTNISASSCAAPTSMTANFTSLNMIFNPVVYSTATPSLYGTVKEGGIGVAGIDLQLYLYDGSAWSWVSTTSSQAGGSYSFVVTHTLAANEKYQIEYINNDANTNRLAFWDTKVITSFTAGQSIPSGDIDIKGILLGLPAEGVTTGAPVNFSWTKRTEVPTDSYAVAIMELNAYTDVYSTTPLGFVNTYTLSTRPASLTSGVWYGWYIKVYSLDGGYGTSYYYRDLKFSSSAQAAPIASPHFLSPGFALKKIR
jgi:M6 family metalloprotease-like protein